MPNIQKLSITIMNEEVIFSELWPVADLLVAQHVQEMASIRAQLYDLEKMHTRIKQESVSRRE